MFTWPGTRARLDRLQEQINELKASNKELRGLPHEWEETLDRITRQAARLNARARVVERAESDEPTPEVTSPLPTNQTGTHARLQAMRSKRGLLSG